MFKRVETDHGGMKMATHENGQKIVCYSSAKNGRMGARNKNARFWWKQLETAPTHGIMFKRVEIGCGAIKMAPSENG